MQYVFVTAAVVGGTVFLFQFLLALIGFGTEDLDFADDVPDDLDLDVPDDFDMDHTGPIDHGSTFLFGVISFRTIVAALTFFGLAGLACLSAGFNSALSSIIAVACGYAAMVGVHWMMKKLYSLRQDGSVRIRRSIGQSATVYIPIPPKRSGCGKVQIRMQGRIMEYAAMTSESEKLSTGAKVVVVDVISPTTLEVEPIRETVGSA